MVLDGVLTFERFSHPNKHPALNGKITRTARMTQPRYCGDNLIRLFVSGMSRSVPFERAFPFIHFWKIPRARYRPMICTVYVFRFRPSDQRDREDLGRCGFCTNKRIELCDPCDVGSDGQAGRCVRVRSYTQREIGKKNKDGKNMCTRVCTRWLLPCAPTRKATGGEQR